MADERGALQAQTFLLPQREAIAQPQGSGYSTGKGEVPFDDGIQVLEGLQTVNNDTSEYYKKVHQLKSFMHDIHKNLGIDVRVPNHGKPESIRLNQAYNNALADIMAQGNRLKNSASIHNQLVNQHATYAKGIDPNDVSAEQLVHGEDYKVGLNPLVKEVNDFNQMPHDSTNIKLAQKKYDDTVKYLQSTKNGKNDSLVDQDIQALVPPREVKDRQYAPPYQYHRAAKNADNAGIMLRKAANMQEGLVGFTPTTQTAPSGELYEANKDYAGFTYGARGPKIASVMRDPKTNAQKIVFDDGKSIDFPNDVTQFVQALSAGQNMGFDASGLQDYIQKKGLEGELGKINTSSLLPEQREQAEIRAQQKLARVDKNKLVAPIKQAIIDRATKIGTPMLGGTKTENLPIGGGRELQLGRHGGLFGNSNKNYSIENIDEIFPKTAFLDSKGKLSAIKYSEFKKKYTNKPLDFIVKNLMKDLPISDYKPLFEALGIPLPGSIPQEEQAPAGDTGTPVAPTSAQPVVNPDI